MWDQLLRKIESRPPPAESASVRPTRQVSSTGDSHHVADGSDGEPFSIPHGQSRRANVRKDPPHRGDRKLQCPVCSVAMELEYIGKIEVDRCPDCGGLFLDKGELSSISRYSISTYHPDAGGEEELILYTPEGMRSYEA